MEVRFREIDPFNFWLWIRFKDIPGEGERSYIDGILDSWYVIGRLGGFNAENLQVHESGTELGTLNYDSHLGKESLPALMHNIGHLEYQSNWARCWVDMGTSDIFSLDVLINSFFSIDKDYVSIEELILGGINEDWPVDSHPDAIFDS